MKLGGQTWHLQYDVIDKLTFWSGFVDVISMNLVCKNLRSRGSILRTCTVAAARTCSRRTCHLPALGISDRRADVAWLRTHNLPE